MEDILSLSLFKTFQFLFYVSHYYFPSISISLLLMFIPSFLFKNLLFFHIWYAHILSLTTYICSHTYFPHEPSSSFVFFYSLIFLSYHSLYITLSLFHPLNVIDIYTYIPGVQIWSADLEVKKKNFKFGRMIKVLYSKYAPLLFIHFPHLSGNLWIPCQ